jgi:hypothetical protein
VGTHFSSVPLGDRRNIDFSLRALIPGAVLVGSVLEASLCFFGLYLEWNCALPVHLLLLPGDLLSFSSFVLPRLELPGLS